MIRKETVDRIFDTARIEEVVGDFVNLKKRGVNLIGLCPFHNEKTPSFNVNPVRNIYKCFGCGKGGTSVNFIIDHEHLSYPDALRYLAKKYSIEIEEEQVSPEQEILRDEKESMLVLNSFAQKYFTDTLFNSDDGKAIGLTYFKERGFTKDTIEKFQLGYSPDHWDAFTSHALKNEFKEEFLVKIGLTVKSERGMFDRFKGRVMFPVHNLSGRVIAFGGRILRKDEKTAKYLNSPESEVYHKSQVLYGIYFAKKALVEKDNCYLTEGYTDVISLHQAGIENVVASSGTSLTVEQIRLIGRYTKNVTVLYDADPAGIKASLRGIDMILEEGLNVRVVLFPKGEDPDSFARNHTSSEVHDYLNVNSKDFLIFKTSLLLNDVSSDPIGKSKLIREIVETISKIPDAITRMIYITKCSELMEIEEQTLLFELNKLIRTKFHSKYKVDFDELEPKIQTSLRKTYDLKESVTQKEEELVRILLNYANKSALLIKNKDVSKKSLNDLEIDKVPVIDFITSEINHDNLPFENSTFKNIFSHFSYLAEQHKKFDINFFLQSEDEAIRKIAIDLTTSEYNLNNWDEVGINVPLENENLGDLMDREVHRYKLKKIMVMLEENQEKIKEYNNFFSEYEILLDKHKALLMIRKELANYLGTVILR